HHFEIGVAEFLPFGDEDQAVGAFEGAVGAIAISQLVVVNLADVGDGLGIVNAQTDASGQHGVDESEGGGFANIVGPGLEGEPPDGQAFFRQGGAVMLPNLLGQDLFLVGVDPVDRFGQFQRNLELAAQVDEGADILGETTAPVAGSGEKKLKADAGIVADAAA